MIRLNSIKLPLEHTDTDLEKEILRLLNIPHKDLLSYRLLKRSLDARKGRPLRRVYSVVVEVADEGSLDRRVKKNPNLDYWEETAYQPPSIIANKMTGRPVVVGTGPAGIFAALILAEAGMDPLLLERGRKVQKRTADVAGFWRNGKLDRESNVQFGEGGAGTFSDGKLRTRVKDKHGRKEKILRELVDAGAPDEILIDSKPHVGTANLVRVVRNLRERIEDLGGEYKFGSRVDDLMISGGEIQGLVLASGEEIRASAVILALGHSARDTFAMLADRGVAIAPKTFSVGFRIEHPQLLIDRNQYGEAVGHPVLGAAEYQLSYRTSLGRTVYSFCMCPGGAVIGAASEEGRLVTNGMSQYERSGKNANSAIVAEIFPADYSGRPLGGLEMQRKWESKAFQVGGGDYHAPIQLVGDFLSRTPTITLGEIKPTYQPGVRPGDLYQVLPDYVTAAIAEALPIFEGKIAGFTRRDAVLTAVETRTSSPLRIVRGKDFQSITVRGLYPAGEGSGYAGGIMSSAIDGIKVAEKIVQFAGEGIG